MTWLWLLLSWACLLAGFILGAWWAGGRRSGLEADHAVQMLALNQHIGDLEDELITLRHFRQAEWERKLDAGGTP